MAGKTSKIKLVIRYLPLIIAVIRFMRKRKR